MTSEIQLQQQKLIKDYKDIKVHMTLNNEVIYKLAPTITQQNIIHIVNEIKSKLLEFGIDKNKINYVYDVTIEILQNILKYSYGNVIDKDNKRQADGIFDLICNTKTKEIIIKGCNLVKKEQMQFLQDEEKEVKNLDKNEIKKVFIEKIKNKNNRHKNNIGTGLLIVSSKVKEFKIDFEPILEQNIYKYILEVKI